jgi:hypothetical protein
MVRKSVLAGLVTSAAVFAAAGSASAADGRIFHLAAVADGDRPMVVAASDRGLVFVGADQKVFRAFKHQQTARRGVTQPFLWIEDIDSDRRLEFVGAGNPSFVIEDNGNPMWGIAGGCDQFFVGDFDATNGTREMFCRSARGMTVLSYDGVEVFKWEGRGYNLTDCVADDFDSDRKTEVACNLSNGKHLFFDVDASQAIERDGAAPDVEERSGIDSAAQASLVDGSTPIPSAGGDLVVRVEGGSAVVTRGGGPFATFAITGGLYSAVAADLDKDGKTELYLGGTDAVYVVDADGKLAATITANPDRARRQARVTVTSATANGLQNSDRDAIRATVEGSLNTLNQCYGDRMGRDQYTRVGQMVFELAVNKQGTATDAARRHSDLANRDLETCISNALKRIKFTGATADRGTVSVRLTFDFADTL